MSASLVEAQTRSSDQILDRSRYQHLARPGRRVRTIMSGLMATSALAAPAYSQPTESHVPPVFEQIDGNGVDQISGRMMGLRANMDALTMTDQTPVRPPRIRSVAQTKATTRAAPIFPGRRPG